MRLQYVTTATEIPNGRRSALVVDGAEVWAETWLDQPGSPTPRLAQALDGLGIELTEQQADDLGCLAGGIEVRCG